MLNDKNLKVFTELVELKKKLIEKMEKDEKWDLETTLLNAALPEYEIFMMSTVLRTIPYKLKYNLKNENIYKEYIELTKKHKSLIEKGTAKEKEEIKKIFQEILGI